MLLENLPHACTAKRRSRAGDGMGGSVDTFPTTIFSARACWRQQLSSSEVLWWQQRSVNVSNKVFFAEDPELDENCILEFPGEDDFYDVKSYASPDASAGLGVLYRVMVDRVHGER